MCALTIVPFKPMFTIKFSLLNLCPIVSVVSVASLGPLTGASLATLRTAHHNAQATLAHGRANTLSARAPTLP